MKTFKYFLALILFLAFFSCCKKNGTTIIKENTDPIYRFMFYNVENLFDIYDDPTTWDEEFTPDSEKKYTQQRYETKLQQIYQVIMAVMENDPMACIGLCEIENHKVLEDLCNTTALKSFKLGIIQKESPDFRGIDVALLYHPDFYRALENQFIPVSFDWDSSRTTRDILYSKGLLTESDTLHIFVNHWPSRSGGENKTEPYRLQAAKTLKHKTDSIFAASENPNIIICGDFNDEPANKSIISELGAKVDFQQIEKGNLYNLSYPFQKDNIMGSYRYKANWNVLDQFIVSASMLDSTGTFYTGLKDISIFSAPFLLEKDKTYPGNKPYRTWLGNYYNGGYSDHLPIYLNIREKQEK